MLHFQDYYIMLHFQDQYMEVLLGKNKATVDIEQCTVVGSSAFPSISISISISITVEKY